MRIDVRASELLPATDSELAWRWTQASHALFSPDELAQVSSLVIAAAERMNRESLSAVGRDALLSPPVSDLRRFEVPESGDTASVMDWLETLPTGPTHEVIASWSAETAIQLPWALFVRRWDDFCYPGADDVAVFPRNRAWVLAYHHWNTFEWGRWRAV